MFNRALYLRETKSSRKLLLMLAAVMTMYVLIMISMYDPALSKTLDDMLKAMPGIMTAFGMKPGNTTLTGFLNSYLYGFILIIFPMLFSILTANRLIARYVDRGAMVTLLSAPVKRGTVAFTQMKVLATGVFLLLIYVTALEVGATAAQYPGQLDVSALLLMNLGLLCLHLFIAGVCFFFSCLFNDTKYSLGFGAGITGFMYILQMLANTGSKARVLRYFTFFTLYNPDKLMLFDKTAILGIALLFTGAVVLFIAAILVFSKKDLHI